MDPYTTILTLLTPIVAYLGGQGSIVVGEWAKLGADNAVAVLDDLLSDCSTPVECAALVMNGSKCTDLCLLAHQQGILPAAATMALAQTSGDVCAILQNVIKPVQPSTQPPATQPPATPAKSSMGWIIGGAVAVAGVIAAIAWSRHEAPPQPHQRAA